MHIPQGGLQACKVFGQGFEGVPLAEVVTVDAMSRALGTNVGAFADVAAPAGLWPGLAFARYGDARP